VEVAKALGGSFKLVTLAPRAVREMTQLPKETQKNRIQQINPTGLYELVLVAVHMENFHCTA